MDIIVNPCLTIPNNDKSNPGFKSYTTDYTQAIYVSYNLRKSTRLEHPYETDCEDYLNKGHFDRQSCVYECKAFNFLKDGSCTEDLSVNQSLAELIDRLNLTLNYTSDLRDDCESDENKCSRLDCKTREYEIINKYHKLDVELISKEIEIRLYLNSAPTSSLEYEALYPLSNSFVQMFIGPASLWLGMSIYSLSKLVFWFLCEITNRKAKKKQTNLFDKNNLTKLNNLNGSAKLKDDNFNTNYSPFYLNDNQNVYNSKVNYDVIKDKNLDKNLTKSIDSYYNQLNKNLNPTNEFSPIINNSAFSNAIPINQLSTPIYKIGLEMYPNKNLKIKKAATFEEEKDKNVKEVVSNDNNNNTNANLKEVTIKEEVIDNQNLNSSSWISKLKNQKTKLINSLLKKNNHKVYPNLIN